MASRASKRTSSATSRSGGVLPSKPPAREPIAPTPTPLQAASQLDALRARTRQAPAKPTPPPVQRVDRDGLRGAKPNPLPPGLNVGARLASLQNQERFNQEQTGVSPLLGQDEETPLLELGTRSYARPDESPEEQERSRQQSMMKTMRQFVVPGGVASEETPEEAPVATRSRRQDARQEQEAVSFDPAAAEAMEEAALAEEFARQQELAQQTAQANEEQQRTEEQGLSDQVKRIQKLWRAVEGVEVAASETIVPLLLLVLQLNVQVINKYFFKSKIIPRPSFVEEVVTCCVDCIVSCMVFFGCAGFVMAVIVTSWIIQHPFAFALFSPFSAQ